MIRTLVIIDIKLPMKNEMQYLKVKLRDKNLGACFDHEYQKCQSMLAQETNGYKYKLI